MGCHRDPLEAPYTLIFPKGVFTVSKSLSVASIASSARQEKQISACPSLLTSATRGYSSMVKDLHGASKMVCAVVPRSLKVLKNSRSLKRISDLPSPLKSYKVTPP